MAHKVNRADLLTALFKQISAMPDSHESMEGSGMLMLLDEIRPVIDISRPSKIPYSDWVGGSSGSAGTALIPAKAGKRIVLIHAMISYGKVATDTGTVLLIEVTVNGSALQYLIIRGVTLTVDYRDAVSDNEIVCDVNTPVTLSYTGTFTNVGGSAFGYYVDG